MPDEPRHDAEATARAEADAMGLGVLDAVDVGGTWTVVGDVEAPPPEVPAVAEPLEAEPREEETVERRPRRRLLWIGFATVAAVLVVATLISRAVPGAPTAPPVAAPGATDRPGITASTTMPTAGNSHSPGGVVVPAGQHPPSGFTPAPAPSQSAPPSPSPTPTTSPTPTPTFGPSPITVTPTSVPPPSPLVTG
jgi:hypothetical protein